MEKIKQKLNIKQECFCRYYATDSECLGNGVRAYIKAYTTKREKPSYNAAKSNAHRLLTSAYIQARINEILAETHLNEVSVAVQLAFLINQHANLTVKARAIDIYYRMKGMYQPQKVEHEFAHLSDEHLRERVADKIVKLLGGKDE